MSQNLLYGPDLSKVTFKQGARSQTCYFLAVLDAILHHPRGAEVLSQIAVTQTEKAYQVQFPGQEKPIEFLKSELGALPNPTQEKRQGVQSYYLGPRILEHAYAKIPGATIGKFDEPWEAAIKIFGSDLQVISLQHEPNRSQWWGKNEFAFGKRAELFTNYMQTQGGKASKKSIRDAKGWIDILTAIPKKDPHHYKSVRLGQSTLEQKIVLADPFDTWAKIQRVPMAAFLAKYHVEGIRLPFIK